MLRKHKTGWWISALKVEDYIYKNMITIVFFLNMKALEQEGLYNAMDEVHQ